MSLVKKSVNLTACLSGLISGGIGILAYSPFDYWWVSLLSATGLIALATSQNTKAALIGVFVWAVSYFAIGVNWVHISMIQFGGVPEIVSYLAVLFLAAYLALYPLLFSYIIQRFQMQNVWAIAAVWTATEYLRGVVFTGFPWLQFGYSLLDSPFSGVAPIFGVEGLTFFVMLVSGYLVHLVKNSQKVTACITLAAVLLTAFASQWVQWVKADEQQKATTISLVQGNIEQRMKWDPEYFDQTVDRYFRLIGSVIGQSELIILPESAIPATERQIQPLIEQLHTAGLKQGSELIMGTMYQNTKGLFNSAVVLGSESHPYSQDTAMRFNKHHLVPFGEYVPFGNLLDWMRDVFILPVNLAQGEFIQPALQAAGRKFNPAICYEIIFGDQLQKNQQADNADYLLTISNDAWFGTSVGPWQHFQMARMRALELGKPLVRATNTGITAFVNGYGRVEKQAPQFETLVLTHTISPFKGATPFSIWGNWAVYGLSIVVLLLNLVRRKTRTATII